MEGEADGAVASKTVTASFRVLLQPCRCVRAPPEISIVLFEWRFACEAIGMGPRRVLSLLKTCQPNHNSSEHQPFLKALSEAQVASRCVAAHVCGLCTRRDQRQRMRCAISPPARAHNAKFKPAR